MEGKKTEWKSCDGKFRLPWYHNTNNYFVLPPQKTNLPVVIEPYKLFGRGKGN
jgi:hypothetical protein